MNTDTACRFAIVTPGDVISWCQRDGAHRVGEFIGWQEMNFGGRRPAAIVKEQYRPVPVLLNIETIPNYGVFPPAPPTTVGDRGVW